MKNGTDFWKTEDGIVPFFPSPSIAEGKGLPAGWVSQWGDKKAQKQTNGSWVFVPTGTPLGMQPFHKTSLGGPALGGPSGSFTPTGDAEMLSYLGSIGFDDAAQQKAFITSPKFVKDMLNKFGTGWYDKYKAQKSAAPTLAPEVPTTAAITPLDHALKTLGYAPDSKQAFVVDQLQKTGSQDAAVNAYSKKFGVKYAVAFHEVEELVKKGAAKGVFTTSGDWDELKVSLITPAQGPVISAPIIAVSSPVSTTPAPKPKAKKPPKAAPIVPPPVPVVSEPAVPDYAPDLAGFPTPVVPAVLDLAKKLGFKPDSDETKVLALWRKNLKKSHISAIEVTADELANLTSTNKVQVQKYVSGLIQNKVYKLPDWDAAEFMVDLPITLAAADTDAVAAFAKAKKSLGFNDGTIGALSAQLLFNKKGDEKEAAKALHTLYANIPLDVAEKLVVASHKAVLKAMAGATAMADIFGGLDPQTTKDLDQPVTTTVFKPGVTKPPAKKSTPLAVLDAAAILQALNDDDEDGVVAAILAKNPEMAPVDAAQIVGALKSVIGSLDPTKLQPGGLEALVTATLVNKGVLPKAALPKAPPKPPTDVFASGVRGVKGLMKKLGYKQGTTGAQAIGLLMAHDGDEEKALVAFKEVHPTFDALFAAKIVSAARKEILAQASGEPAPEKDPGVAAALAAPPPVAPTSTEPAIIPGPNVATAKDSTKKGVALPDIPPMVALSYKGDAQSKLGGNKPKKFLVDNGGGLFLHKYGADKIRAAGGEVAANLAALVAGPGGYVPVKSVEIEGDWGTVQPMVPGVASDLSQIQIGDLTKDQIRQLQRERVIDWVASNHDSKAGNFIVTKDGNILGIDKEQAFKFIGKDTLSLDYSPNPSTPVYNTLYGAYADKAIDLDPNDMLPFVQAVENVPEEDWKKAVQPYLDALPEDTREEVWASILARKQNVRKQFEKFFTTLKKKRGEDGPFSFAGAPPPVTAKAKAKKQKVAGVGLLVPPNVPSVASMTYAGKANIGGAGEKHFYTASDGKKWMLKVAAGKGTGAAEPWKAASQILFATIGKAVKPKTLAVGPATYNGKPATLQPWMGDGITPLAGVAPQNLTDVQKSDVADEHVLDWLLSQHDTHGANLLVMPDGGVIGIDKEQGFKYLLPNAKWTHAQDGDKLSTDFHPNAQYGEGEPYYNKFWKAFADGKMDFDPTGMVGAIAAIESIPDDEYVKALEPYAQSKFSDDAGGAAQFYGKALQRKKEIRADFESFITDQYQKRTKKKGKFAFDMGWAPEGGAEPVAVPVTTPVSVPSSPVAPGGHVGLSTGKQYSPLPDKLVHLSPQISDTATAAGFAPSSEEAKVLALVQSNGDKPGIPPAKETPSYKARLDLITLGWDDDDAGELVKKVMQAVAKIPGFNYSAFMASPAIKPTLTPSAAAAPAPKPLPPPPASLSPETISAAGAAIDIAPNSVYWNALDALAKTGTVAAAVEMLTAAQPMAAPLHLKRVKFVHKKLKDLGVVMTPPPLPTVAGVPAVSGPVNVPVKASAVAGPFQLSPNKPTAKGALGIQSPALVYPTGESPAAPKSKKPPTPEGFPEPPDGQMWEVSTAAQFAQKHVYKLKTPKDAEGNPDASSPNAVLKLVGLTLDSAKEYLTKLDVSPLQSLGKPLFKEKDGKIIVLVNKEEWEKAKKAKASNKFSQLVPIPPPAPPPGAMDKFKTTVKAGELKNPEAVPNLDELKTIQDSKEIGFGAGFFIGGGAVETQSVSVQRRLSKDGKEYYRFNFKIREPYWQKFSGGKEDQTWRYHRATYKPGPDAWQDGAMGSNPTDSISGMTKWESEGSEIWVGTGSDIKYAYKGMVFADVSPKAGETPFDAFARTLDAMQPGFSKQVLKNPTKEERDLLALSALYWSVAPKEADKLKESDRTVAKMKERLTGLGYSEKDFENLGFERVALDRIVPVLKGRSQKLKDQHNLQDITIGVSTPERVAKQLASGTIGVVQRLQHGIACPEGDNASPNADQGTGGADYLYAGITKKGAGDGWSKWVYGQIQMVYDISELDRLDIYQHASDQYGCCDPKKKGGAYKERTTLENNAGNCFEVMFRRGIAHRKLLKVLCHNQSERDDVVAACKQDGITHVNGVPIEDLVIAKGTKSPNGFYSVHLEPAGY